MNKQNAIDEKLWRWRTVDEQSSLNVPNQKVEKFDEFQLGNPIYSTWVARLVSVIKVFLSHHGMTSSIHFQSPVWFWDNPTSETSINEHAACLKPSNQFTIDVYFEEWVGCGAQYPTIQIGVSNLFLVLYSSDTAKIWALKYRQFTHTFHLHHTGIWWRYL